jgi:hypothetical protein
MRGVYPVHAEGRGRVLHQRDVVPELRRESAGGFDARVGQQANHDDFGDPVLLQQHVEIGIRKAAGPPMFVDDNIARLRREIRMQFAAPAPFGEHLPLDRLE